jgi:hypothetical protein
MSWSFSMKNLTTALCVALFALSAGTAYAADAPKKEDPAKAAAKSTDKAASSASAKDAGKAASAATATPTTAKKKEKKGGC